MKNQQKFMGLLVALIALLLAPPGAEAGQYSIGGDSLYPLHKRRSHPIDNFTKEACDV